MDEKKSGLTTGQMLRSQDMLKQLHERLPSVDADELADEINQITTELAERYLEHRNAYIQAEGFFSGLADGARQKDKEKDAEHFEKIGALVRELRLDNSQLQWFIALLVTKLKEVSSELRTNDPVLYERSGGVTH